MLGDNLNILLAGSPNRVYNMDETAMYVNPDANSLVIAEAGKPAPRVGQPDKDNLTVLLMVNAAGQTTAPFVVWGYERIPERILEKMPPGWSYGRSPSGWMTAKIMYEYICNEFYPDLVRRGVQFPVSVSLDGHASHLNIPLSEFCSTHGIIIICLPPNCTHIQVLDVVYFRPLKLKWVDVENEFRRKNGVDMKKEDVPLICMNCWKSMTLYRSSSLVFARVACTHSTPNQ